MLRYKVGIKGKFPISRFSVCSGSICLLLCVMSLMFCHNAGNYTFTIYDNFCGSIPLLVIALFECVGVAYFYGLQRFSEDWDWIFCCKYMLEAKTEQMRKLAIV